PGWSATVDGQPATVLRADGVFRGVAVPPGRHTVAFSYRNPDEMRGRLVAGAGLVMLVALVLAGRNLPARRQPKGAAKRLTW
ncbi:MAG TPA: YfhO family protein, partial [Acidimicrobiales bacterium]|nr:YfhO family protein [Acidimicrobiales bacterium]